MNLAVVSAATPKMIRILFLRHWKPSHGRRIEGENIMATPEQWTQQLFYLARDAMGQRSFMAGFQQMTACRDAERDEILWERMDKARNVLVVHMSMTPTEAER